MDWISDAGDNGERLFEYLRRERPDVNAWFVVDARCPTWDRLRAAGVRRLVAHGSFTWTMLMLNASWLLSSYADAPIVRPRRLEMLVGPPAWRYGFLQHGVAATDLSRWLNPKQIDLFVVSTGPELASIAGDGSPHPNMRQGLPDMGLPDHVEALTWARDDVQALFARTALVVTDYSSVAFDVAYLDRPVVYYQFDWVRFTGGRHTGQPGYFDFQHDGLGPVTYDHDAAVAAIIAAIEHGPTPTPEYLARIARTFPVRDGGACARVVAAVEEMSRPWVAPPHA